MTDGPTTVADRAGPTVARTADNRRADVQGLRAIAVLMVVAFHAGLAVPGGFTGVDVFFVISGFVITAMLQRELGTAGGLSFSAFYARRVRRILPASALTISLVALGSLAFIAPSAQKQTARTGVAGSLFVANVLLGRARLGYFDIAPTSNPLLHIWSLSVEEQFYLVFPALLLAGFVLARRRYPDRDIRSVAGALVGSVAAASFALSWYGTGHEITAIGLTPQLAFYLAPTRAWEFAAGALLALGIRRIERLPRALGIWCALGGTGLLAWSAFGLSGSTPFPGTAALYPVIGTTLLIVAGTLSTNVVSSTLAIRPMTRIGDLSYSWYLWHWPLIVFMAAVFPMEEHAALIGAAISILPAWLSFAYLESPVRRDTRIRGRRALAVAAACVAIPIACSLILYAAPTPTGSAATRAFLEASTHAHSADARGCNLGIPVAIGPPRCTYSVPETRGRVVLVGDSNAGHFAEPAAAAANRLGFDLTLGTYPDCPFVDVIPSAAKGLASSARCHSFVTQSLHQMVVGRPNLVVLAASAPLYFTSGATFRDPTTGRVATTPAAKAALWSAGLARVLRPLKAAGIPTVVVHTVPQWATWDTRSCAAIRVYLAPRSCGATQSRAEVDAFRRRALAADARALAAVPGTVGIDLIDDLCTAKVCATNRGDLWLYKDGRHISVVGARRLTNRFVDIIRANVRR
jgi:peptidoglycan/LPS O-acetylase OafA/YrhL